MNMMRRGFTLVELVVVIGLIILLVGLTLSVGVAVVHQSEARQTRAALLLLDTAVQEWEVQADRKLTWWDVHDSPALWRAADVHGSTREILIITEVLGVITKSQQVREIIARIDPQLVYTYHKHVYPRWITTSQEQEQVDTMFDGGITVLDAWGWPVYATHPGRTWVPADAPPNSPYATPDPDGTIMTYNEEIYGVACNRRMCFISAGPDVDFGDLSPNATPAHARAAEDNLYSYPVQPP